ncbi:MAG: beta-1,4-galactosyltransferase [Candidatus Aenigmarchaeota archaeon]|nr:beta-1,4-galactosyltransferase [Candidatus Aenigmarchaeota archaeon]
MILVAVGTDRHEFRRLVKAADKLAEKMKERIVIQIGRTKLIPKNCEWFDILPEEEFQKYLKKARVVVTHAGVGLIVDALKAKKPTVVVPRRKDLNEHVDNHQFQIAKEMDNEGKVVMCEDVSKLKDCIKKAEKIKNLGLKKKEKRISYIIRRYINNWFSS